MFVQCCTWRRLSGLTLMKPLFVWMFELVEFDGELVNSSHKENLQMNMRSWASIFYTAHNAFDVRKT